MHRLFHLTGWSLLFLLWISTTSSHHPTLSLTLASTAVLVGASAALFYLESLVLRPRLPARQLWFRYAGALLVALLLLDAVPVLSIQLLYDWIWGPDPLRFGFWTNMAYDGVILTVHLIAAMAVERLARRFAVPANSRRHL